MRLYQTNVAGTSAVINTVDLSSRRNFKSVVSGNGPVNAVVSFYGSNDSAGVSRDLLGTITLAGTTYAMDDFWIAVGHPYTFVEVESMSGRWASVETFVVDK